MLSDKLLRISAATHNGNVRENNEDNFSVNGRIRPSSKNVMHFSGVTDETSLLLAVYDGMGGEEMGEVASETAAKESLPLLRELSGAEVSDYRSIVDRFASRVNTLICTALRNNEQKRGGTTMALVYVKDGVVYPFSLGDSRIYLHTGGELVQITEDHTLAMRKYKANIYTFEEALTSPDSHKLTLFLGVDVEGNGLSAQWYQPFRMPADGKLLLCSDGLYDMCGRDDIAALLSQDTAEPASILLDAALENGGRDNITCITLELVERS